MERLHKERHRAYTLDFKLAVVDWLHSHSASYRAAARRFGIDRKMVRDWVERKEFLRRAVSHYGPNKKKLHHGRKPFSLDLDKAVLDYLVQERAEGRCVRDKQLTRKALEFSHGLGLDSKFKATSQWLKRWKRRVKVTYKDGSNHYDPDAELFEDDEDILAKGTGETILSQCYADNAAETQDTMRTLTVLMDGEPNSLGEGINSLQQSSLIDHNYCKSLEAQDESYEVVIDHSCAGSVDIDNRSLVSDKLLHFDGTIFEFSAISDQVSPEHQDF